MHLLEILLPLNDNEGRPFNSETFSALRERLTERFGGLTAFTPFSRPGHDGRG